MRLIAFVLIPCFLLVALTGCEAQRRESGAFSNVGNKIGKGAPGAESVNGVPDSDRGGDFKKIASEPTASPGKTVAPKTESVIGGASTGGPAEIKAAKDSEIPAVAKPEAGVAEAVVGREKPVAKAKQPDLKSGILTAGSFDDNINPQLFSSYVRKMSKLPEIGDLPAKLQGQRVLVIVKDANGKPVGNARVKLSAGAAPGVEVVTRSDGRAVFILSLDHLPGDQALVVNVTGPNGGDPVTDTITAGASRWEIAMPRAQGQLPKTLDLAIVLDTTGSMGDELKHLQAEIRGISSAIAKKFPEVKQRLALICYRDEGDEYVVRRFDFTESLDLFHKNLSVQSANGGGDYPEAMHKGLEETMQLQWHEKDTCRVAFLIADAPPHAQHMNRTLAAVNNLRKKGVALYPVACSGYDDACEFVMRSSAVLTGSQFLFLTDDSGVGDAHGEPKIPYYQVERLEKLMVRMIASELSGQQVHANPADIIRTVGKKVN